MDKLSKDQLAERNGQDGKKAYVSHEGKVYDVTESKRWKNGVHMGRHKAGSDLTVDMKAAPHGTEVFENFSQVGELANAMTKDDLAKNNGQDDAPTYVAVDGKVYDVSESKMWKKGKHMNRHNAGADLSTDIKAAPHGMEVFEKFTMVGSLAEEEDDDLDPKAPWPLSLIYEKFPFIKRHAHPFTVHFPLAFWMGSALFLLLFLALGHPSLEATSFHLLLLGTATAPFAILSGLQSWWLFYGLKASKGLVVKVIFGPVTFVIALVACAMHLAIPGIMDGGDPMAWPYVIMVLLTVPLVGTVGFFGGQLTFPE